MTPADLAAIAELRAEMIADVQSARWCQRNNEAVADLCRAGARLAIKRIRALDALVAEREQAMRDAVEAMLCWRGECCDGDAAPGMDTDVLARIEQYERELEGGGDG